MFNVPEHSTLNIQHSTFHKPMSLIKINTPVDEATIRSLHVGDTVAITGRLYTGRDAVHHRLHSGVKPPVDLDGHIIYHCGPVMVRRASSGCARRRGRLPRRAKSRTS